MSYNMKKNRAKSLYDDEDMGGDSSSFPFDSSESFPPPPSSQAPPSNYSPPQMPSDSYPPYYGGRRAGRTRGRPVHHGYGFRLDDIPWRIVIPVVAVIVVLGILWIERDTITFFTNQMLVWAIKVLAAVLIIGLVFRWIFGPRRW